MFGSAQVEASSFKRFGHTDKESVKRAAQQSIMRVVGTNRSTQCLPDCFSAPFHHQLVQCPPVCCLPPSALSLACHQFNEAQRTPRHTRTYRVKNYNVHSTRREVCV
ncbi:hypothetical protein BaRGS_00005711 [Batillaria attramentaria]|uniref:Uncharacterized protein n=1 Tax=Batillaria attramentaria TaxID=370345 RepID=A0ABD0LV27_9CAEN